MKISRLFKIVFSLSAIAVLLPLTSCAQKVTEYKLQILEQLPHDKGAYTQGLFFYNGELYESCGQYGSSSFKKLELKSGKDLRRLNFDSKYFVEGSCVLDNHLYVLTWMEHKCFVYDINSWKYLGEMYNPRQGWGLTTNGKDLILSDGSSSLFFLDPMTFALRQTLKVTLNDKPLNMLNELEYIDGDIWANVYTQDFIVIIDSKTGKVKAKIDCTGLLKSSLKSKETDVLNGIAYNPDNKEIYLTGKYWPRMFKVSLVKK